MVRIILIILLFIANTSCCVASVETDSLRALLSNDISIIEKQKVYETLCENYFYINANADSSVYFGEQALDIMNSKESVIDTSFFLVLGKAYFLNYHALKGIRYIKNALPYFERKKDTCSFINAHLELGWAYLYKGDISESKQMFDKIIGQTINISIPISA